MPRSGTTKFTDAADYQASIPGAKFDLVFNCQRNFEARLTWVQLRHLRLLRAQETLPRVANVSLMPSLAIVTVAAHHDPPPIFDGIELQQGDILFHSLGQRVHQRTRGPSGWGIISLAPKQLAAYGKVLKGVNLVAPRIPRIVRPSRVDAAHLFRLHTQACRLAETKPRMIAHPEVARALEQELLHTLVNCLTANNVRQYSSTMLHHMKIMVRFEDILATQSGSQLRIAEICTIIGVSERMVRVCCAEFVGISPNRYVRLRRLNMVRAALRHEDARTATIGDLAFRYGFTELGRFAGIYRAVFGETPSATLRREKITRP